MATFEKFPKLGASVTSAMVAWTVYQYYIPSTFRDSIQFTTSRFCQKLFNYLSPYLDITFDEYTGDHFNRSEIYTTIQNYLGDKSSTEAKSMKADYIQDGKSLLLSLGDNEEVIDVYKGVKVSWSFNVDIVSRRSISIYSNDSTEKRYYKLIFHSRDRNFILNTYLPYVLEEGEAASVRKRTRKLFTNIGGENGTEPMWNHVAFKHPASFNMLALEESKKQMIMNDLLWFQSSKDYYAQVGKPWKRGYLLYGPPGTGKSTLVAAMANLLDYDIYDLELTSVKDNMQLKSLLIETTGKSIILIEDIDCSLDLTGQRKSEKVDEEDDQEKQALLFSHEKKGSAVTLSGLLNFIDGIWSACGEERIIVFTTNHKDKLDPALIRPGRMDMHIELSYCGVDAFKLLAKNYLRLESHPLFSYIERLLGEIDITPAQVAESLMPRSLSTTTEACLQSLITVLEKAKEVKQQRTDESMVKRDFLGNFLSIEN